MTKGKEYSGSTNLKHMTDAMMNLLVDEKSMTETYVEYAKNRDGKKNIRLYFTINEKGVEFNEARFKKDNEIREKQNLSREALAKNGAEFEDFFLNQQVDINKMREDQAKFDAGLELGISTEVVEIEEETEEVGVVFATSLEVS